MSPALVRRSWFTDYRANSTHRTLSRRRRSRRPVCEYLEERRLLTVTASMSGSELLVNISGTDSAKITSQTSGTGPALALVEDSTGTIVFTGPAAETVTSILATPSGTSDVVDLTALSTSDAYTALQSLTVSADASGAVTKLAGDIATSGDQFYDDPVDLESSTSLSSSTTIAFNSTIDGAASLSAEANAIFLNSPVGSTTALSSLTCTGLPVFVPFASVTSSVSSGTSGNETYINAHSVTTTGDQNYDDAVILGEDTTLTAATAHVGSLDSDTTPRALTIHGAASLAQLGTASELQSVSVSGAVEMSQSAQVITVGAQSYTGAMTLDTGSTIVLNQQNVPDFIIVPPVPPTAAFNSTSAGDIHFGGTIDGASSLTVSTSGVTTFGGAVGATQPLANLTTDSPGGTSIVGGAVTTSAVQNYGGAVTLSADTTLAGSSITFNNTLDSDASARALTLKGAVAFGGAVGGGSALASLSDRGTTDIAGAKVTTVGAQSYTAAVTISANTTLNASSVTFQSTLDSDVASFVNLTINGGAIFDGAVGDNSELESLTVSGATDIGCAQVTTFGAQTYEGPVTLSSDTTLDGSTATFDDTLDSDATTRALTIAHAATFEGSIGSIRPLKSLEVENGAVDLNGGLLTTTGALTFASAVKLTADTTLDATSVAFESTVDSDFTPRNLTINAAATFDDIVGGASALASLLVTGTTEITNNNSGEDGQVTTNGTQDYQGDTTLDVNTDLTASVVTFGGSLSGGATLHITGSAEYDGSVNLTGMFTTGGADIEGGGVFTPGGGQGYGGPVTIGSDTTITSGSLTFSSTVDSGGAPHGLSISADDTTFSGAVGESAPLASLNVASNDLFGGTTVSGGTVTTTGSQSFSGTTTFTGDTSVDSTEGGDVAFNNALDLADASTTTIASNGGNIDFSGTVDGNSALTTDTAGTTTFAADVGSVTPLASIQTGTAVIDGTVDGGALNLTAGTYEFTQALTVQNCTNAGGSIQALAGGIIFDKTIDSNDKSELTVSTLTNADGNLTAQGVVQFDGNVGAAGPLGNLAVETGGPFLLNVGITTQGDPASELLKGNIVITLAQNAAHAPANLELGAGAVLMANGTDPTSQIRLLSPDGVSLDAGSQVTAAGTASIYIDGNRADGTGVAIDLDGTINSPATTVTDGGGSNGYNLSSVAANSTLTVTGGGGYDALFIDDRSSSPGTDSGAAIAGFGLAGTIAHSGVTPMVLTPGQLPIVAENSTPGGTLLKVLLPPAGPDSLAGIAVTSVDNSHGDWQYQTNAGNWTDFGSPSAKNARLLAIDNQTGIRFVPDANFLGTVTHGIVFHAWSVSAGANGTTADTTGSASAFSDVTESIRSVVAAQAPTIATTSGLKLPDILENAEDNSGTLISTMLQSVNGTDPISLAPGTQEGIAVTAVDNSDGDWQFSTDAGNDWTDFGSPNDSAARLLPANFNTLIRFAPTAGWHGTVTDGVTFRAWDQTSGLVGGTADTTSNGNLTAFSTGQASASITVDPVANTPTVTNAMTFTNTMTTLGLVISSNPNDAGLTEFFKITSISGGSLYQHDGQTQIGDGAYLTSDQASAGLRFLPNANSVAAGSFQVQASLSDGDAGLGGAVATAAITVVNHAPVLSAASGMALAPIEENELAVNASGTLVKDILASASGGDPINDLDPNSEQGIAIIAVDDSHGDWQFSTDGGTTWSDIGPASTANARLLASDNSTRIRYLPDPAVSGLIAPGITFRAWDQTSGMNGGAADTTSSGDPTAFSSATNAASITIEPVAEKPTVTNAITVADAMTSSGLVITPAADNGSEVQFFKITQITGGTLYQNDGQTPITEGEFISVAQGAQGLKFLPAPGSVLTGSLQVQAALSDDNTALSDPTTATITLNNHAPIMQPAMGMILASINENEDLSANDGTLVSAILNSADGGDPINDPDSNAQQGISVFAVDNSDGDWQFSTDGGAHWADFGSPTVTTARLLAADAETFVRFLAQTNWSGEVSSGISFCAWDQTSGANGGVADSSDPGVSSAFSTGTNSASIVVNFVNQPPSFTAGPDQIVRENDSTQLAPQTVLGWAANISPGPAAESQQELNFLVQTDYDALFSSPPAIDPATGTLTYTPALHASGVAHVTVELHDNGGTTNGGHDTSTVQSFTIDILGNTVTAVYVVGSGSCLIAAPGLSVADAALPGVASGSMQILGSTATGATGGTFTIGGDGSFTFTPGTSFPGFDDVNYQYVDAAGHTQSGMLMVVSQTGGVVWKFFEQVLHRDPTPADLAFFIPQLSQYSPGVLSADFFESDELLNQVITGYYQQYLGRAPQGNDLTFWEAKWRGYGGPELIIAQFASSTEFNTLANNQYGPGSGGWVTALYERILKRDPRPDIDVPFWEQQLAGGTTEGQVALDFVAGQEGFGDDVTGWFNEYLGRAPTPTEKTGYVNEMLAGETDRDIEQQITNLPEYSTNPPKPPPGTGTVLPDYLPQLGAGSQETADVNATDMVFSEFGA